MIRDGAAIAQAQNQDSASLGGGARLDRFVVVPREWCERGFVLVENEARCLRELRPPVPGAALPAGRGNFLSLPGDGHSDVDERLIDVARHLPSKKRSKVRGLM